MKDFGRIFGFDRTSAASVPEEAPGQAEANGVEHRMVLQLRPTIWADMANAVWALQQKSRDPATSELKDEFRAVYRHVERLAECLTEIGIEAQNHTNQPFDSGQSLEVIAFQPTAGIAKEIVLETIRPSVYLKGRRIQVGQVIVATPQPLKGAE
jgi:hypothetical protein